MLDYFLVHQMGLARGWTSVLLYLVYIVMVVFLLNDLPRSAKGWGLKAVEVVLCWAFMHLFNMVYYAFFQDNYLHQAQEVAFTVLYAALRSRYPVTKRIVMGCAAWSSKMLLLSIYGSLGMRFSAEGPLIFAISCLLLVCFFRRFAIDEFSLASGHYIAVVAVLALSGGVASANWDPVLGKSPYFFLSNNVLFLGASPYIFLSNGILLGTVLLVYYSFYCINVTYQRNLELMAISQRQQADAELLAVTEQRTQELRMLRHELKNHDAYIQMLLEEKRYDELSEYVRQNSALLAGSASGVDCGNRLISYILERKRVLAKLAGAEIRYQIAVPPELPVAESELTSLLSNLLDNAIEACREREEPSVIFLRMDTQRDYLFLHMENPFAPSFSGEQRLTLKTTKPDQTSHGYGTRIIHRIAEKYNGYVEYHVQDEIFISDVMLAVPDIT